MKIAFVTIGKFKSEECEALLERYLKLAEKYASVERHELAPARGVPEEAAQDVALEKFLEKRGARTQLTILDETGKTFTSRAFAEQTRLIKDGSHSEWIVAVAGAHGFGKALGARAKLRWSLSPLTFPHELAAAMAAEQLFRALSILANHPYHND